MAFSFFGGVHPKENKRYARDKEIQAYPEPDILVIPMQQHIGAPCKPLVKKNDLVTTDCKVDAADDDDQRHAQRDHADGGVGTQHVEGIVKPELCPFAKGTHQASHIADIPNYQPQI